MQVVIPPPYARDLHNGKGHKFFADTDVVGYYNVITHNVSITFNHDLDNVEILIYKDGSVCEQDIENSVRKADFKEYLLSTYGKGKYTISVKVNGIIVVSEEIVL